MLTSTVMGTGIQFSLNHAFKIDPRAPPQHQAREDSSANAMGQARSRANRDTWGQVVRRKTDFGRTCRRRSRDTWRVAVRAGSFNILTAGGTVLGISLSQCRIVHHPAERWARMQPQHMPAARAAPMFGTQGRSFLTHPRVGVSCWVSR